VSSYYYIRVLILLFVFSYYCIRVLILLYVSSSSCIGVLIVLYMCPHTTVYVSSSYYICVLMLLVTQRAIFELNKSGRYYEYKERLKKSTIAVVRESFFKEVSRMLTYVDEC
jgi:hypothetical protein